MVVVILVCGMTIMAVNNKSTRQDELEYAVSAAVQQTLKEAKASTNYRSLSQEKVKAMFIQNLFMNIQSEGNIEVEFYGIDYRFGLLDVKVTEKFEYVGGKEGEISVRKTAIYE